MIEAYFMIFCIFIIAFVVFAVIDRVLFGEWYTVYSVRHEHMRSVLRMWMGDNDE